MPLAAKYIGYTKGTENLGDEALAWLIRDRFKPHFTFDEASNRCDLALLGGGTLINQSPWLIDYFQSMLDRARFGLVFGTGVGDSGFWGNQFDRWRPLLKRCWRVGVRGPHSLKQLLGHEIEAVMIGDPFLQIQTPFLPVPIAGHIGVNLGLTNDSLLGGGGDRDFHKVMIDVLNKLRDRGCAFEWFSVWSKDLPVLKSIREQVAPESSPVIDARLAPLQAFSALSRCEMFIGEKLHACALAAVAGVPFVGLEYQPKVRDFAASTAMGDMCVSTAERDPALLLAHVDAFLGKRESLCRDMNAAVSDLRQRQHQFLEEFFQHIVGEAGLCAS